MLVGPKKKRQLMSAISRLSLKNTISVLVLSDPSVIMSKDKRVPTFSIFNMFGFIVLLEPEVD